MREKTGETHSSQAVSAEMQLLLANTGVFRNTDNMGSGRVHGCMKRVMVETKHSSPLS